MKLSQLLKARETLVRQAGLANLAFAYETLGEFNERIDRAQLRGEASFKPANPDEDRYWATLTAREGSQAVIEEHFTEEDLTDYADAIAYATGREDFDITFRFEEFAENFLGPLRRALVHSGIEVDGANAEIEERQTNDTV